MKKTNEKAVVKEQKKERRKRFLTGCLRIRSGSILMAAVMRHIPIM